MNNLHFGGTFANFRVQIRNKETSQCLDTMGRKASEKVGMVACHGMGGNQVRQSFPSHLFTDTKFSAPLS